MIQANDVHMAQQSADSIHPPAVTGGSKCVPVVNGVAPELSVSAEVIGRNSRHETRTALLVKQKELWVGPNIAGIRRNKERNITYKAHAFCMRVLLEPIGLPKQQELFQTESVDLTSQFLACTAISLL